MARVDDTVTFPDARLLRETEKAILVEIDEVEYWVPKSQVDSATRIHAAGDEGELVVSAWWVDKQDGLKAPTS